MSLFKSAPGHFKHYMLIVVSLCILVFGQIFGKIGSEGISISEFNIVQFFDVFIVLAYTCLILQGFVWIFVVRKFDLSFAYPFMSLSFVLVLIISSILFDETMTILKILGSLLITFGVAFTSAGRKEKKKND